MRVMEEMEVPGPDSKVIGVSKKKKKEEEEKSLRQEFRSEDKRHVERLSKDKESNSLSMQQRSLHPAPLFSSSSLSLSGGSAMHVEMRSLTQDYEQLLRRATDEIRTLTNQKLQLHSQCDQLLTVNEELARDLANLLKDQSALRAENEAVVKANADLFNEAQRLSDKESNWNEERLAIETLASKQSSELQDELDSLQDTVRYLREERDALLLNNEGLEKTLESTSSAQTELEQQVEQLRRRLEAEERRGRHLDDELGRLRRVANEKVVDKKSHLEERERQLVERNQALMDWRQQLIDKNAVLVEENSRLKNKCQNLEDLLNEEETDIKDLLDVIKAMQNQGNNNNNNNQSLDMAPISKFREQLKLSK